MKSIYIVLTLCCLTAFLTSNAQSASGKMVELFNPSTVRNVYEIVKYVPLGEAKQIALAKLIEKEDLFFAKCLKDDQVISTRNKNILLAMRKESLQNVLSEKEIDQYYRGISDSEAEAMAIEVREKTKIQLGTSYQEGKFIFASFYKIFLESKVAELKYADSPKQRDLVLKKIKDDELKVLLEKSGLWVDENLIAKRVWRFKPNTPLR
ncbi:MAG: hypothetical protein A2X18_14545 [Bacteroidetes bacterium GWF2_40_14]|nr:MAG: hypothetical protein A2X18_14545 [Bacteroidetes bacterium GWF2_40_14]